MFWKKSPLQKLNKKYEKLKQDAYNLSKTDRMAADLKEAEAEKILKEIEVLEKAEK